MKRMLFGKYKKRIPLQNCKNGFYRGIWNDKEYVFELRNTSDVFVYKHIKGGEWQIIQPSYKLVDFADINVISYPIEKFLVNGVVGRDFSQRLVK
jgi:hypothetical protein